MTNPVSQPGTTEGLASGRDKKGSSPPVAFPLLPDLAPESPLAIIDVDSHERGACTETAMIFNTTRRMRLATGAAILSGPSQREYVELPPPPQPRLLRRALLALAPVLRPRPKRPRINWERFFDADLLQYDQLNAHAAQRIDALERAGWGIVFLTSLPDTCFETRMQQLLAAGLLRGKQRGLICKPQAAQFLKTRHWKALVVAGTRVHHSLSLSDQEYRLLPDLLEFFPWMARGLLGRYQSTRLLYVDDEVENCRALETVSHWFSPRVRFTILESLDQVDALLASDAHPLS